MFYFIQASPTAIIIVTDGVGIIVANLHCMQEVFIVRIIKIENVDRKLMKISSARDFNTGKVVDLHGIISVYQTDIHTLMNEIGYERGLIGSKPEAKKIIRKSFDKLYPGLLTPFTLDDGHEVITITSCWLSDQSDDDSCIFIGGNRGVCPELMGIKYELVTPEIWFMEIYDARVQGVIN